jgi:sugar transferase (PEP-CTERM/EpsH1 system associated)
MTQRLPYAPNRGDRIRAYHTLQMLHTATTVDVVSLVHDREEAQHVDEVRHLAASIALAPVPRWQNRIAGALRLPSSRPLTHSLLDSPAMRSVLAALVERTPPDVVLAYCSSMARFALDPPLDRFPLVIDMMDVDSLKWQALAPASRQPLRYVYAREARCLRAFERTAIRAARTTVVVNDKEREALASLDPAADVRSLPSGVDTASLAPTGPAVESQNVVFCGVMNYQPNEDAAVWLARAVWPRVLQHLPAARLQIVGATPSARVRALQTPSVEVTGSVPDVRPYLWNAALATAPLRVARGIQNKVLEAVAAGLPVVTTTVVREGLPAEVLSACRVEDNATAFADAIITLLRLSPQDRRAIAGAANLRALSWASRLAPLLGILQDAAHQVQARSTP